MCIHLSKLLKCTFKRVNFTVYILNPNRAELNFQIAVRIPRVGEDVGGWGVLYTAGGNTDWCNFFFFFFFSNSFIGM